MRQKEKKSYLLAIRTRYLSATKLEKAKILDEFCADCGYNRKYTIRALNQGLLVAKKKRGPRSIYNKTEVLEVLKKIWFAADQPCSKKLKVIISLWLPSYEELYGKLEPTVKERLLKISSSSIDRILSPVRAKSKLKGKCTTRPGALLKSKIPIQLCSWNVDKPGYLEADTVTDCGDCISGKFAWSLTVTDIHTGWTENRATWNKWSAGIYREISNIEFCLPFKVLGFDSDNGSEFMNYALYDYFTNRDEPVIFTRSRPYQKNDNAHVEQKNWTHVRHLLGYDRLDNKKVVKLLNDLYRNQWSLYQNHFIPCMKLIKKERVGSRYKKIYDAPKTPYEIVLGSEHVSDEVKEKLVAQHNSVNPFILKKEIEDKLTVIFSHVKVTSNVSQRL